MSSDPGPIRILSVDDHPLIRQGVAGLVATEADMNLDRAAANGREATRLALLATLRLIIRVPISSRSR
jgi:DNA-binding NarL/FixJ family response regulator